MHDKIQELKTRLQEVDDLDIAASLLDWDQSTYMPPEGATARGRQLATLARLSHEKFVDPAIGKLLDQLEPWAEQQPYDSDDASLIRVTRRDYEQATKIPTDFLAELSEHSALSYQAWAKARPENDFASLQPILEKTLDYSRKLADFFPGYEHIADPLIDFADYGMKASDVRTLFSELRQQLSPIVQAITAQEPADDSCLRQSFPEAEQMQFCEEVARQIGYDFQRGRMDKTHHPFMTKFSLGDVRITTQIKEDFLGECLYSVIHEAGHAMYEQGIRRDLEGTPLADGTGDGLHESQSRLWENIVGRSRPFTEFFYPRLQALFPNQLKDVSLETYYRAINKVERSLIRTDADELTYIICTSCSALILRWICWQVSWPSKISQMPGMPALRKILECMHQMTEMGCSRMSTGLLVRLVGLFRGILWAMCSVPSSTIKHFRSILKSRTRSGRGSLIPCGAGSRKISISMVENTLNRN